MTEDFGFREEPNEEVEEEDGEPFFVIMMSKTQGMLLLAFLLWLLERATRR